MKRNGAVLVAGWLVLAAFVLSGLGCSPTTTTKSSGQTGGSSNSKPPSTSKTENPPKRDPG